MHDLISTIDALLPQTQCGKCGHVGCRPYAEAMAAGQAHNLCPPGGQGTVDALAELLDRPALPLDDGGDPDAVVRKVAWIREDECIGCTKCIQACPVDAIVGAARLMHTVLADECTGCDLCVEPCPVDCIDMVPLAPRQPHVIDTHGTAEKERADHARSRFEARKRRLDHERAEKAERRRHRLAANRHQQHRTVPVTAVAADDSDHEQQTLALKTAYNKAHKQYKQAREAMVRAQRQGTSDLQSMSDRVERLRIRAEKCHQTMLAWLPKDTP